MALRINTNVSALDTHRNLMTLDTEMSTSLQRLSSGLRINRASDDAAGLSIGMTLDTQVRGLGQALNNAQDGINLINTADGAMGEITDILQRMRELAVESANGTLTNSDRTATSQEYNSLMSEIDDISSYTTFNGYSLVSIAQTFTFQVGANNGQTLAVSTTAITSGGLTLTGTDTSTQTAAQNAITSLDTAIAAVDAARGQLGAASNRLTHTINNISVSQENLSAAESQIMDTDMAAEMTNLTREQILTQSATAMLSQANAAPQSILSLFR